MQKSSPADTSRQDILGEAEVKALAQHAVARTFPKNTVVVTEGDRTDSLYIIVSGRGKIYASDENGKEIILSHAGPGEYFGEFVTRSPEFSLHVIRKLIRKVRVLTNDVKSLALMDVYGRVARMLLDLATEHDGTLVIENRPTQQEMANRVGASREMISRILSDLANGGYINVERDRSTIARTLPRP